MIDLPVCGACGAALPPSRVIYMDGSRIATACAGCLTVEEHGLGVPGDGELAWVSRKLVAPGAEVVRERGRFIEELAAGTLARRLAQDPQRFNRLAIPEIFEAARPLFHRPVRFHRAQGLGIGSAAFTLPALPLRFLEATKSPAVFSANQTARVCGMFGELVMLAAPDGGTPMCVAKKEIDLGMPDTRLVLRGDWAAEGSGPLFVAIDGDERATGIHVSRLISLDPYGGNDGETWTASLSDAGSSLFLVHWVEKWNPGYDETERFVHRSEDGGRTWTPVAEHDADRSMQGAELLHSLTAKHRT